MKFLYGELGSGGGSQQQQQQSCPQQEANGDIDELSAVGKDLLSVSFDEASGGGSQQQDAIGDTGESWPIDKDLFHLGFCCAHMDDASGGGSRDIVSASIDAEKLPIIERDKLSTIIERDLAKNDSRPHQVCLVKTQQGKLCPGILFENVGELQMAIESIEMYTRNAEEAPREQDDKVNSKRNIGSEEEEGDRKSAAKSNIKLTPKTSGRGRSATGEPKNKKREASADGKSPKKKAYRTRSSRGRSATGEPKKSQLSDKDILERHLDPYDSSYQIISNETAWELLEAKYPFHRSKEGYYITNAGNRQLVASSITKLRENLCELGLPRSTIELTDKEKIDIARWVRFAKVSGLSDGQTIGKEDHGKRIFKFMDAWSPLVKHYGCYHCNGKYFVPRVWGNDIIKFESDGSVQHHFARFGIECLTENGKGLTKEDRLEIEIFFAKPPIRALDTFSRLTIAEATIMPKTFKPRTKK